jgi:hypothetical protein
MIVFVRADRPEVGPPGTPLHVVFLLRPLYQVQ